MPTNLGRTSRARAAGLRALAGLGVCALATAASASPAHAQGEPHLALSRFEVGAGAELTLVGLAGGLRVEALYRPGAAGSRSRIRFAPGLLEGPEFHYVPVALGYRAVFRQHARLRPLLGAGFEYQQRWVSDAEPARQVAFYTETGVLGTFGERWSVGLETGIDWTFIGGPGPGLVLRAVVVRALP